jgi:hypothetical protein
MIHTYPQSEIQIKIDHEEFAHKHSPKWEESKSQKRYPSKLDLWQEFQYHTDGYLIKKQTGRITKSPKNPDTYRTVSYKGKNLIESKCIAIMHLPEGIEAFEQLPQEPVYEMETLIAWAKLIVDHIQEGNKHDNRIENLQIISTVNNWWKSGQKYNPPWLYQGWKYDPKKYQQSARKERQIFYTVQRLQNIINRNSAKTS